MTPGAAALVAYLVLLILPGLLGIGVYRVLVIARPIRTLDVISLALALTLLANVIASPIGYSMLTEIRIGAERAIEPPVDTITLDRILVVSAIAIALTLSLVWIQRRGWTYRLLQRLGLTEETGRINVWHDVMSEHRDRWIEIEFKDGKLLLGWLKHFSVEDVEIPELFLGQAVLKIPSPSPTVDGAASSITYREVELGTTGTYVRNFDEILYVRVIDPPSPATDSGASP